MNSNEYLSQLSKVIDELNRSLDQNNHQKILMLCAALQEFRRENVTIKMDNEIDQQKIADILPLIDCLIQKMENNKQQLSNRIFTVRKSIQISKNQGEL